MRDREDRSMCARPPSTVLNLTFDHSWVPRRVSAGTIPVASINSSNYDLPVVCELQVNSEIFPLQESHRRLQLILALAQYPHLLALNLRLHFEF